MKPYILLLTFCFLVPGIAVAQSKKIPVAVFHDGDDSVGRGVAFALKEAIRTSQAFTLLDHEGLPKTPRIVVRLLSLDIKISDTQNLYSAFSITILYDSLETPGLGTPFYNGLRVCGRNEIEQCTRLILPLIDHAIEILRTQSPNLWKTL
jgi:hypothetical protein